MSKTDVCGILNIHKPADITSRKAVDVVQRIVRPAKVGHGGTLDPLATGVLVVCVGAATRLIPFVQQGRKVYRAKFQLGRRSNTDDITGEIETVVVADPPSEEQVVTALQPQIGEIEQVPPQFSAVHVNGKRAYKMARRGKEVDIPPKVVQVHRIDVITYDYPELELDIECGSGTYIRSIGRDLGDALGCGAVMTELVRTGVGGFHLSEAVELDSLTKATFADALQPPLAAVAHLPRHRCNPTEVEATRHGRTIATPLDLADRSGPVALLDPADSLIAIAFPQEDQLTPKNVFIR